MKVRFQQLVMVVMMLFAQLQPLQVHALVLDAEQSGHVAGQLSHNHVHDHANADHDHSHTESDGEHESQCHPSHTPLPLVNFYLDANHPKYSRYSPHAVGFVSADLALDTPPPKAYSS